MEDEEIERLRETRRKKRRKFLIALIIIMCILSIFSAYILMLVGLLFMVMGVESMIDIGSQMVKIRYYKYMTAGFHELVEAENKGRDENFMAGIIIVIIGFGIFLGALYLLSVRWNGFLNL